MRRSPVGPCPRASVEGGAWTCRASCTTVRLHVLASPRLMSSHLSQVHALRVPSRVIDETWRALRDYAEERNEGFVLWLGQLQDAEAVVDTAFVPPQESVQSEEGVGYFVTTETLFGLNVRLSETKLKLLAQVHSHPGRAYHSTTDDAYAVVTTEGGFSIVVPDFAADEPSPSRCAVYRLQGARWRQLTSRDVKNIMIWGDT